MVWKRKFANNYLPQNQATATSARYRHVEQSQRAMALATKRRVRAHAIRGGIDSLGENHAGAANTITITVTVADRQSAAAAAAAGYEISSGSTRPCSLPARRGSQRRSTRRDSDVFCYEGPLDRLENGGHTATARTGNCTGTGAGTGTAHRHRHRHRHACGCCRRPGRAG
jgi:hypothetical protein